MPTLAGVAAVVLATVVLAAAAPVSGQDVVTVRASDRYAAGALHRALLGDGYRDVWAAPVRVEVLDLATFAGGLTPLRRGGGRQTRTLHMEGADGRRYIFRSVDKHVSQALPEDLQRTFVETLFQDHMSALHPTGALAVPPLLAAAGVLHVVPRLVVMPDDPRLGEHRAEFAGMLGQIEERPDEGEDGAPGFAGSTRVVSTERLIERLDESADNRVDAAGYLTARLVDFLIGDTDRGSDQWRWAGEPQGGDVLLFRPVPRDRDWAYVRSEGPVARVARGVFPKLVAFGPDYPSLKGLVFSSLHRDRRLLAGLQREAFDSVAALLRSALTDAVIDAAIAALPPEHAALEAERMAAALRARRDALPDVARSFYGHLAGWVDVHGTEEDDLAEVTLRPDGAVEVRLLRQAQRTASTDDAVALAGAADGADVFFHRVFQPGETREVRLYLGDGDDRARVTGGGAGRTGVRVRVVGGPGDDELVAADGAADGASDGASAVSFHAAEGEDRIIAWPGLRVDRRPFTAPADDDAWVERKILRERFRDWGSSRSLRPVFDYGEGAGVMVGARWSDTRYGFRRVPHARRVRVGAMLGLDGPGIAVDAGLDRPLENSAWATVVTARASQLDAIRFYGYGNATPALDPDRTLVPQDRVRLEPGLRVRPSPGTELAFGARADYTRPRPPADGPLAASSHFGGEPFGALGAWGRATLDRSDGRATRGFILEAGGSGATAPWDAGGAFGGVEAEARAYATPGPTLAFRAGGRRVWGAFPVQDAAFLGGKSTLRGYRYQRFAGDAAVYGSAEARAPLTRALILVRGELGAIGFVDAGRVFVDGASPGGWHSAYGGGLTFTTMGTSVSATIARGEETRLYLDFGMPF